MNQGFYVWGYPDGSTVVGIPNVEEGTCTFIRLPRPTGPDLGPPPPLGGGDGGANTGPATPPTTPDDGVYHGPVEVVPQPPGLPWGGAILGGILTGIAVTTPIVVGNIQAGLANCQALVNQGIRGTFGVKQQATKLSSAIAQAANGVEQMIHNMHGTMPQECIDILNDILNELAALAEDCQALIDSCNFWLQQLATIDCASASNLNALAGNLHWDKGVGPALSGLQQQIQALLNDITQALQRMQESLAAILAELANFPPDGCRRKKPCRPGQTVIVGIIPSGPFAGQPLYGKCKSASGRPTRVLP